MNDDEPFGFMYVLQSTNTISFLLSIDFSPWYEVLV